MALFEWFRATDVWKAFILNSIVAALVILIAMLVKGHFDTYKDEKGRNVTQSTNFKSISLTLLITFGASMTAFTVMHFLFAFGGGMTISS